MNELAPDIWVAAVEVTIEGETFLPGWYFTDETQDFHGPWSTIEEAEKMLRSYVASLG